MKKVVFIILFLTLIAEQSIAQKGTSNYLSEKNGFKCFTLATPITNYSDKVSQMKEDPDFYSVTDSTLLYIGDEIKLSHIFIKTFNDSIYSISLMAKPQYKMPIRRVLVAAYGVWTYQPNRYMERYFWMSNDKKIELSFDGTGSQWVISTFKDMDLDIKRGKAEYQKSNTAADDL